MTRNNFKLGFRNMQKHRGFAAIHIFGLVLGITSSLFIMAYVHDEASTDQFHQQKSSVFRIDTDMEAEGTFLSVAVASGAMGPAMVEEFPEVLSYVRLSKSWSPLLVRHEIRAYFESEVAYADANFFELFDFELQRGAKATALEGPFKVILSQALAEKYFGDQDPIGQHLEIKERPYEVTGIFEASLPASHLNFDLLLSFDSWIHDYPPTETNWGWSPTNTYLRLTQAASATALEAKLPDFVNKYMVPEPGSVKIDLSLTALEDLYFEEARLGEMASHGNRKQLYLLLSAALLIIALALGNFINLSSARASIRLREVGVRKVLGAHRQQLIGQFFAEAMLFAFLSLFLALGLFVLLTPAFSALIDHPLSIRQYLNAEVLLAIIGFGLVLGFLAGLHPAITLSANKPVDALQRKVRKYKGLFSPRKAMITFQFFISVGLLVVAVVMWKQFELIQNRDLGFYKDQTLVVDLGQNPEVISKHQLLKNELLNTGVISGVSYSSHAPGEKPHSLTTHMNIKGENRSAELSLNIVDEDFVDNYGLELLAGRSFSTGFANDTIGALMLNESAVSLLGLSGPEEAIGLDFSQWGREGKVIGVVKDFNFQSLHTAIEPLTFQLWPEQYRKASLKLSGNDLPAALDALSTTWTSLTNEPFNYKFLDQRLDQLYAKDQRFSKIFRLFTILSLAVAALGLVGFSSFIVRLRAKELAIRKVLGAAPSRLIYRLLLDFSAPAGIALLLALAPAYWFLNDWLNQFAYRVSLSPAYLLWPVVILLGVIASSVLYQSTRVALENPTRNLRNE